MKRRHPARVPEYLQHIVTAIDKATGYVSGMTREAFQADSRTQDAVIRSIEIVGEAAQQVRTADPEFAARHADIPWDLWLGVWERSPRVIAFYVKSGFVKVGSHVFVVGSDNQTDLVFVRTLP
jgi:uncharacterized protein with HEPN domain